MPDRSTRGFGVVVAERVAPHKRVRLVEFVDAIPTSAAGRTLRRVLAAR